MIPIGFLPIPLQFVVVIIATVMLILVWAGGMASGFGKQGKIAFGFAAIAIIVLVLTMISYANSPLEKSVPWEAVLLFSLLLSILPAVHLDGGCDESESINRTNST